MGLFSFGKKDDAAPRRRGAETGSGSRSSQGSRVERRSRRPDRSGDAEAMLLDPTLPEKQRARRRLVGAIALVVAAIVILPMVLDSHPKPVTGDIAIDIPSRPAPADGAAARDNAEDTQAGVAPDNPAAASGIGLPAAVPAGASAAAAAAQIAQNKAGAPAAATATPGKTAQTTQTQAQTQTQTQTQTQPQPQPSRTGKPTAQTTAANTARGSQGTRSGATSQPAQSSANGAGKTTTAAAAAAAATDAALPVTPPGARYAVQLGAFANEATARNWVTKLKAAGVPAYTEQSKQADGTTRTLLRAGPFADRTAATDAIAKVRGAGLMAGSNGAAE